MGMQLGLSAVMVCPRAAVVALARRSPARRRVLALILVSPCGLGGIVPESGKAGKRGNKDPKDCKDCKDGPSCPSCPCSPCSPWGPFLLPQDLLDIRLHIRRPLQIRQRPLEGGRGSGGVSGFVEGDGQVEEPLGLPVAGVAAAPEVGGGVAPAGDAVGPLRRQVLRLLGARMGVGHRAGELEGLAQLLGRPLLGQELARLVELLALGVIERLVGGGRRGRGRGGRGRRLHRSGGCSGLGRLGLGSERRGLVGRRLGRRRAVDRSSRRRARRGTRRRRRLLRLGRAEGGRARQGGGGDAGGQLRLQGGAQLGRDLPLAVRLEAVLDLDQPAEGVAHPLAVVGAVLRQEQPGEAVGERLGIVEHAEAGQPELARRGPVFLAVEGELAVAQQPLVERIGRGRGGDGREEQQKGKGFLHTASGSGRFSTTARGLSTARRRAVCSPQRSAIRSWARRSPGGRRRVLWASLARKWTSPASSRSQVSAWGRRPKSPVTLIAVTCVKAPSATRRATSSGAGASQGMNSGWATIGRQPATVSSWTRWTASASVPIESNSISR